MTTIRKVVSDIINELSAYNLDDRLSYRYVKNRLFDAAAIFVKQDAENRRLFKLSNLWAKPECIDLEEVSFPGCESCKTIKRTKVKLPEAYQTSYGLTLKVLNADLSAEYLPTTPSGYSDISAREYESKIGYYWLSDGYLYIPDNDEIDYVMVTGIFKEGVDVLGQESSDCKKPLDFVFSFPDYIISLAKTQVINDIIAKHIQIPVDERPDDNTNQKA